MGEAKQITEQETKMWNIDEKEEEAEAEKKIYKYIFGFVEQAVVKCAIELNIADTIDKSPMTLSQLSSALNCDASRLYRIMRFLTHRKIFKQIAAVHDGGHGDGEPAYAHTPLSRLLMKKTEQSMAALLLLLSSPVMLSPWQNLSGRVKAEGTASFEKAHGQDVWKYAERNAELSELINEGMACDARKVVRAIVEECGEVFEGVGSVVDVGGGNGTAMRVLTRMRPGVRCVNYDLAHVVSVAPECERVEHVVGDMFVSVPKADAAFLMWVLHDWGDEECIQILKRCKEAIPEKNGKVIIAEAVIEEEEEEKGKKKEEDDELKDMGLMADMAMMAQTNSGKERTLKEWEYVIKEAGFSTFTVKHIRNSVKSVIIAFP